MTYSENEWSPLKEIIVGTATNAHWPVKCKKFRTLEKTTLWDETPVPSGLVDKKIVDEANQDLDNFSSALEDQGVVVHRPRDLNFQEFDGMYNYCPRDRALVVGDKVIDAPMLYPTRTRELEAITDFIDSDIITCDEPDAIFDAANVCRLGKDLLYLVSDSGNYKGAKWLQSVLGKSYNVHILDNIYRGVHIDSTISPVREGLVVINSDRVNESNLPKVFKNWDIIWIGGDDIVPQSFINYPYASKYIALNFLTINPNLVACDSEQHYLKSRLNDKGVNTLDITLRHSRTLGGGHHCVTLDLRRD